VAHHHFTRQDRVLLARLKFSGLSNRSCARILHFHPSTIRRELKRGAATTAIGYDVRVARERAKRLRLAANQQHRKLHAPEAERITALLKNYYSPEQAGQAVGLSHATVYRWLWAQPKAFIASMWKYLRHKKHSDRALKRFWLHCQSILSEVSRSTMELRCRTTKHSNDTLA
jgi:IS30 family transposase